MSQDTIPCVSGRNERRIAGKHAASGERPVLVRTHIRYLFDVAGGV